MKKLHSNRILNWLAERNIIGTPTVGNQPVYIQPNRAARRFQQAQALKQAAVGNRRKYEKRGAPGRSSKGRAPLTR